MSAAPKTKKVTAETVAFTHDALAIRTVNATDKAYNDFQWPTAIGTVIDCPDWDARPRCGNGFHALLDGIGDWSLTHRDDGMIWQVVGVIRDECVAVGDDKVKFPRCELLYRGDKNGALKLILPAMVKAIQSGADGKIATGYRGHAAATGDSGHAAATGYRGHAAATGDSGHAAATGYRGVAVSLGYDATAQAGPTGWIVLSYCSRQHPFAVERVERFKVGEDGVEAGKTYRLSADGKPVEVRS